MKYKCVGCGVKVPLSQTSVHDAKCEHHSHRESSGWSKCRHAGVCYIEVAE